jgi:hypothetical protein
MDPNKTFEIMLKSTDRSEVVEAAENLSAWLDRGGYLPTNVYVLTGRLFGGNTAARFFVDGKIRETLAATGALA